MRNKVYVMTPDDSETVGWARKITNLYPKRWNDGIAYGGRKELQGMDPETTLYVMAHGTSELLIMVNRPEKRRWTPAQVASQLEADGLSKRHKFIELLVCEGANAVNTVDNAAALARLRAEFQALPESAKEKREALNREYVKLLNAPSLIMKCNPEPIKADRKLEIENSIEAFRKGAQDAGLMPVKQKEGNWSPKWLLPFGAALMNQMKNIGYSHLWVFCYTHPIATTFTDGEIEMEEEFVDQAGKTYIRTRVANESDRIRWM